MDASLRIGLGTDLHRLSPGRPLWLGGVEIPSDLGADAHSDGDVVLHALVDALLGAVAEGDIGSHFPDTDPRWRGADSSEFVRGAREILGRHAATVVNVDVVVELQRPRIAPHRERIRDRIAELLELPRDRVSVKGKTGEGVGPIGRGEAVSCQAVVLISLA